MDLNSIEIQIFVSCPGDVNAEKDIVAKVCERVNKNLLKMGCNIHLQFRDFSEIIGPTGIRPQQLINDNITGYDIYIGILHMRFGTPTGATNPTTGRPFESGTEEEFVIASDKKLSGDGPSEIFFFFKKQVGSGTSAEHMQAGKVLAFKESLMPNNWVNSFDTTPDFERLIMDLLTTFTGKLCISNLRETKKESLNEVSFAKPEVDEKVDITSFVPPFAILPTYITRSISQPQKLEGLEFMLFRTEMEKPKLKDLVVEEKRIVILGNAGSGKSVELQQTAKYFTDQSTPFISIYKRFNTYTNESIEDFLPIGWNKVDPNVTLLLLDGLDEIQPLHFNTAVRKLIDFAERNSKLRIVISCRTNFYELPNQTFSGTLTGFKVYMLNDISLAEINSYTGNIPNFNWDDFINQIYNESYLDLVQKPFFLDILIDYYNKNGNFLGGRSAIIENSILSMIELDKEHFKNSMDIPKSKKTILALLEKVAFVMEVMGKNFITEEELETILSDKGEYDQIKHFSAFAINPQKGHWMFEHNNIQEFLASKVLAGLPFERLIKTISFPPSHNKIKPTWVNTLSFFISISEPGIRKELINWIVDKDQEILVKFEPDRVDRTLRIQIFKEIFNFYKKREVWLSSNKFNNVELTRFSSFAETLDFLLVEIKDSSNSRISRLNAISLIDNYDLNDFDNKYKVEIKDALINVLADYETDTYVVNQVLYAFGNLKITDDATVDYFVDKFSKRKNQYVRAGLYKLINNSENPDQYADLFLNGLNLAEIEDAIEDRESVNLMDESWQLREGISKMKSPAALKKILGNLKSREERRRINRYDNKEVIESILANVFGSYDLDKSLYDDIYDVFITAGKEYDREYALMITPFFKSSKTEWSTFNKIWQDDSMHNQDKAFLLELILDKDILDQFVNGYKNRDFTNQDVELFYEILIRNLTPSRDNSELIDVFEKEIKKLDGPILERPQFRDWTEINKNKAQESFDLLFNKEGLLSEIKSIFAKVEKDEVKRSDLWELRGINYADLDDYFISSALELLRDFTTNDRSINYYEVAEWVSKETEFEKYQIDEIYQAIHSNRSDWIKVSEQQLQFIIEWCIKVSANLDIENAVKSNDNSTSINWQATRLWFFINRFKITIPESKMLEFTLFFDFEKHHNADNSSTIKTLEEFVNKTKIEKKVSENLNKGITESHVWASNASYAIENSIKSTFPSILNDFKNSKIREHFREQVLELYFKKTANLSSLQGLLETIANDQLKWKIVTLLVSKDDSNEFLINFLGRIISNEFESQENKISAARFLTQLNDISGFMFIAKNILENKNPAIDYNFRMGNSSSIKDPVAIPTLLELLKLAKQPEFKKDSFNNLESFVLDALYHIGIQSEDNFEIVKNALDEFTKENANDLEHLNFLYFNIRRIEEQLYLKKSQDYSVIDAIKEYQDLNL